MESNTVYTACNADTLTLSIVGYNLRITNIVISTFDSFGAQAQALIKDIGRRTNLFVPPSLSHETS